MKPIIIYLLPYVWGDGLPTKNITGLEARTAMTNRTLRIPLFLASSALFVVFATAAVGLLERL